MATENEKPEAQAEGQGDAAPEKPAWITAADLNKAISAREKRTLENIRKMLDERDAAARKAKEEDDDEPEAPPAAAAGQAGQSPAPPDATVKELAKLRKQQAAIEKELQAERAARAEEVAKSRKAEQRTKLSEVAANLGVEPKKMKAFLSYVYGDPDTRRAKDNAEGQFMWLDDDGDEVDLVVGMKALLASEEGKGFLPARGAQGSGAERGTAPKAAPKNGRPSKEDVGRMLMASMLGSR